MSSSSSYGRLRLEHGVCRVVDAMVMQIAASDLRSRPSLGRVQPSLTLCRDPEAEARIQRDLRAISVALTSAIGASLRALLLVGSYARGDGGATSHGAYNDYDLIAVVHHDDAGLRAELLRFSDEWTARLGVHVDVWPFEARRLGSIPPTLFWLDVSLGGVRVLAGDKSVDEHLHPIKPRDVPLSECGRLLANRAVGLAISNLEGPRATDESLARHAHKAALACGDVRLLAADRYASSLREKLAELERLESAPDIGQELVTAYREAIRYRTRPEAWAPPGGLRVAAWYRETRAQIAAWHLRFEAFRMGTSAIASPADFARMPGRIYDELPDVRRGGSLPAALRAALKGKAPIRPYVGHPRERLARAAVALAYGHEDPEARVEAAVLLGAPAASASDDELLRRMKVLSEQAG
jgi:predicted nucleotidyltransferase